MMLRLQHERMTGGFIPTLREYSRVWGLGLDRLKHCRPDVLIMHPGPVNRGVEISPEVADSPYSVILDQVTNGVAARMAALFPLAGGEDAGAPPSRWGASRSPRAELTPAPTRSRTMAAAPRAEEHR